MREAAAQWRAAASCFFRGGTPFLSASPQCCLWGHRGAPPRCCPSWRWDRHGPWDTTAVHKKTARNPDFSFSMRGKANIFCYICRVDAACVRAVPQHRVGRCREAFGKFRKEEKQRWRACGVPASVKGKPLRPLGSSARKKNNAGGLAGFPQASRESL